MQSETWVHSTGFRTGPSTQYSLLKNVFIDIDKNFKIEKLFIRGEQQLGEELYTNIFTNNIQYTLWKMTSLFCLKKGPVIDGEKSIASQLRVIFLSEGGAYELRPTRWPTLVNLTFLNAIQNQVKLVKKMSARI